MKKGRYENDYYTIQSYQILGGNVHYGIMYLDNGMVSCGFDSADFARNTADRAIDTMLVREKRFDDIRPLEPNKLCPCGFPQSYPIEHEHNKP